MGCDIDALTDRAFSSCGAQLAPDQVHIVDVTPMSREDRLAGKASHPARVVATGAVRAPSPPHLPAPPGGYAVGAADRAARTNAQDTHPLS